MLSNDYLSFQILDWNYFHEENEENENSKEYNIRLFGRTDDNKSIYVKLEGFTPYFYIEVDEKWKESMIENLIDFAKKNVTYRNFAEEKWVNCGNGLVSYKIEQKYKFSEFTNFKKFKFVKLIFRDLDSMRGWASYFKKKRQMPFSNKAIKFNIYESNIEPFLRCMHIRNLEGCGWAKIPKKKLYNMDDSVSYCDINVRTNWSNIEKIDGKSNISKFIIAAFDIECTSSDGSFPQANRDDDKIIQIGTTFSRFGESECFYQHIITLGSCNEMDGVDVVPCKNEKQLLLEWTKMLNKMNPDILTGYNIFGFDYKYMKDRAQKLGVDIQFSMFSRITDERSNFIKKDLSSSALGKNIMTYYDMTGRVNVDLMKVVQKDYKLASYKLDYVASFFIKESVHSIVHDVKNNRSSILTNSIFGVKENQYITILYSDGTTDNRHMDGKKFLIKKFDTTKIIEKNKEIEKKVILVDGIIDLSIFNKGYKIYWCQSKDDISPNDIFRLQKGTSKDRAIIAKYCLMDCVLCNKLMEKLCIITNNVGMANVCSVPLSYLFYRGQSIKVYSLVSKKCRQKNHLAPVLDRKKPKTEEEKKLLEKLNTEEVQFEKFINHLNNTNNDVEETEDDDDGYEGATVFPPETGVHYDPVTVLDYSSLYPNSMILRNLSHEYLVKDDEKYGNLPGYKYHCITYLSNNIIEKVDKKNPRVSILKFKKRLNETIQSYKKLNYIIEQNKEKKDFTTNIYDLDKNGNKRYLVTKIIINNEKFILSNFETAKFAEKLDGSKGIMAEVLQELLDARKKSKKLMENETDPFQKSVYDGRQNAEKVSANSVYGGTGAPTSPIYKKEIAASTTATGKYHLEFSKHFLENVYDKLINLALKNKKEYLEFCKLTFEDIDDSKFVCNDKDNPEKCFINKKQFYEAFYANINKLLKGYTTNIHVIYGDTDSTFFKPRITNNITGEIMTNRDARAWSIQLGIWGSIILRMLLHEPMVMAYEKVLHPFVILTKKRYVGNLYETDPDKFYMKSMGIVLKRRDNAPIVKIVVGGIIDQIINKQNSKGAVDFTKNVLKDILSGKFPMDKFIITKTLKGPGLNAKERLLESEKNKEDRYYADRTRIVHAVLADRIADRDYGNRPQSNDRIAYVYKITKGDVELQGDRVETPEFIINNKIKIDYLFYITNQIMKPAIQFLELLIEEPNKIFEDYIIREENRRKGQKTIKSFYDSIHDDHIDMIDIDDSNELNIDSIKKNKQKKNKKNINKKVYTSDFVNFDNPDDDFKIDID